MLQPQDEEDYEVMATDSTVLCWKANRQHSSHEGAASGRSHVQVTHPKKLEAHRPQCFQLADGHFEADIDYGSQAQHQPVAGAATLCSRSGGNQAVMAWVIPDGSGHIKQAARREQPRS